MHTETHQSNRRFIFISYARRDARDLAVRLRDDLLAGGHQVWLDTAEIEGGASWSNEIEEAIETCDIALALLSHGAFVSEICRAEQLRALRKNKTVIPILVQPNAERPLHLEHLNYRDFTDAVNYPASFDLLKRDLLTGENIPLPEVRRQTIVSAPPLPPHFIHRAEELAFLRRTVVGDDTDEQIALTALRGMGGIGKSVLATALCHDEVIQAAFPDGVIWVTIGKDPGNLTEQMKFIGTKLGDSPGYYTSEVAGSDRLRTLLAHKAVLLVLDDVWNAEHIQPFRLEAPRCRTLFTTRDGGIALAVGASEVRLGTLNKEQSLALLREWAGRDDEKLADIAEKLGNLPLALKLAGARLREGMTGIEWLNTFQHVSQIKLGRRSSTPHENLEICFDLSVQQLMSEDQLLYHAIGVFPEDVAIPQKTIIKLWRQIDSGLSDYDATELVIDLARLALVDRNQADETITLHDLLHDYTRTKLGGRLSLTHQDILMAYNPHQKAWWDVPHDGYLYHQLGYHLIGAGRQDDFLRLLVNSQEWLEAKFIACMGDNAYVADLDLAMRQFKDPLTAQDAEWVAQLYIARQIVTIRASVYTDDDLETLVWLNRTEEAVNHARLRIQPDEKAKGLMRIYVATAETLTPSAPIRDEMLQAIRAIDKPVTQKDFMREAIKHLRGYGDKTHFALFREMLIADEMPPAEVQNWLNVYQIAVDFDARGDTKADDLLSVIEKMTGLMSGKELGDIEKITLKKAIDYSIKSWRTPLDVRIASLVKAMLDDGQYDEAISLAIITGSDSLLESLAEWFFKQYDPSRVFVVVSKLTSPLKKHLLYEQFAVQFAQKRQFDHAQTAMLLGKHEKNLSVVLPIIWGLLQADKDAQATRLLNTVEFPIIPPPQQTSVSQKILHPIEETPIFPNTDYVLHAHSEIITQIIVDLTVKGYQDNVNAFIQKIHDNGHHPATEIMLYTASILGILKQKSAHEAVVFIQTIQDTALDPLYRALASELFQSGNIADGVMVIGHLPLPKRDAELQRFGMADNSGELAHRLYPHVTDPDIRLTLETHGIRHLVTQNALTSETITTCYERIRQTSAELSPRLLVALAETIAIPYPDLSQAYFVQTLNEAPSWFKPTILGYIRTGYVDGLYRLEKWIDEQPEFSERQFYRKDLEFVADDTLLAQFLPYQKFIQVMDFIQQTKNDDLRQFLLNKLDVALKDKGGIL